MGVENSFEKSNLRRWMSVRTSHRRSERCLIPRHLWMPCPDTFTRMPPVKVALERSSTECGESDHSVRARSSKKCANVTDAPGMTPEAILRTAVEEWLCVVSTTDHYEFTNVTALCAGRVGDDRPLQSGFAWLHLGSA